jgi:CRISPR/Cas system-associated exonuclease Cas4 (RecB family)
MALTYETRFNLPEDLDDAFFNENIPRQALATLAGYSNILETSKTESTVDVALNIDLTMNRVELDFSFSPPTVKEKKGG